MYITMSDPTIAHLLICSVAICGITIFWLEFTAKAVKKVAQLTNEMFADKGAEERKRQREREQEVRRRNRRNNNKKRRSSSKRRRRRRIRGRGTLN